MLVTIQIFWQPVFHKRHEVTRQLLKVLQAEKDLVQRRLSRRLRVINNQFIFIINIWSIVSSCYDR